MTENLPIGPLVDTKPAARPQHLTLTGQFVTLVPLTVAHVDDLYALSHGPTNEHVWTYLFEGPFADKAAFAKHIEAKAASSDPFSSPFSIMYRAARSVMRP
jgi:hypothetical protein